MPSFDPRLKELYLNKPECVITLPEWLLPSEKIKEYRAMSRLAIVEIAGRDSVAAAIEAVKTVSDLFMPVSGEITEFNEILAETPEKVNQDPYGDGWIVKIKISDTGEIDELLDAAGYKDIVEG